MAKKSKDTNRPKRAKRKEKDGIRDGKSDYQNKIRAKKLAEGSKAKGRGCGQQMLLLFVPFVAVAAYWFLKP